MIDTQTNTSETDAETEPSAPKRKRGNAIRTLRKASARLVRNNSTKIAAKLLAKTLEGDVQCAKLLVALIQLNPPPKLKDTPAYRSWAEEWENELKWEEEMKHPPDWPSQPDTAAV